MEKKEKIRRAKKWKDPAHLWLSFVQVPAPVM